MAAVLEVLADERQPAVVASHGNLISLLLHAFDGRPGFATWEQLSNPDVFEVVYDARDGAGRGALAGDPYLGAVRRRPPQPTPSPARGEEMLTGSLPRARGRAGVGALRPGGR